MWERFKRWLRSVFGDAMDTAEDPEKILRQNIKDMNDQVPVMNQNIATIRANVMLLENQKQRLTSRQEDLKNKIKAALQTGNREIALNFATQLEQTVADIDHTEKQLVIAKEAVAKANKIKAAFLEEKERRMRDVQIALAKAKQAEWQRKVADALESFEVAGISQTHEEMVQKIEEKAAVNQARMEMALEKVEVSGYDLDRQAERIRAEELLKQFEMEMGIATPEPISAEGSVKTLGPVEELAKEAAAEMSKTLGQSQEKK